MQTRIQGTITPVLEVQLDPTKASSQRAANPRMPQSIHMTTHTQMGGGGGLMGVFKRAVAGGSIFMTEYRAFQYPGEVAFATKVPGHIVPIQLGQGVDYLVHRHGFLCATPQVTLMDLVRRSEPASLAAEAWCPTASAAWHGRRCR